MNIHEAGTDELTGDGLIIIDGLGVGTVYYSMTLSAEAGGLIAEGSITGSEELMSRVTGADRPRLALEDGPVVMLDCAGGDHGIRWVRALCSSQSAK